MVARHHPCSTVLLKEVNFRPVGTGGARDAMAPPNFDRSVNPISTGEQIMPTKLLHAPRGVFDLPTALNFF